MALVGSGRYCDPLINRRRVLLAIMPLTSIIFSASNTSVGPPMEALPYKFMIRAGKKSWPLGLLNTPLICAAIMRPTSRLMRRIMQYAAITRSLDTVLSCVVGINRFFTKYTHRFASGVRLLVESVFIPVDETSHFAPGFAITRSASSINSVGVDSIILFPSASGLSLVTPPPRLPI